MPARTLSPTTFHSRRPSRSTEPLPPSPPSPPGIDEIVFPKVYEHAWGTTEAIRSDLERSRIFLVRIASMDADAAVRQTVRGLVQDASLGTVPALAEAVQRRVFGGRHATFAATPLLQAVRFMLLRARVADAAFTARSRAVLAFFFDPALARNLDPPPAHGDGVAYAYPAAPLRVAVVGGGPTGLAAALALAEKGAGQVEVHVWERRWVALPPAPGNGGSPYVGYPPDAKRRDQVVTLQDSVTALLSPATRQALFEGRPEAVWPGSANLQIRKVEDRLLRRCQAEEFRDLIHLHAEGVSRDDLAKTGDFHVLLGADGAASWVRKAYFHGYETQRGKSFALGLAFDRPAGLPWSQPLNVFLTLGQTRYLLNASDYDGRGYLNMQLTEDEWHRMVSVDGLPVTFGRPGCFRRPDGTVPAGFAPEQVFAPSEERSSPLWGSIADGLKLFGFKEDEVTNVVRIPIVVQGVEEGVRQLPTGETGQLRRPHALVAVAGDAAMTVHFWPGRGLNSGLKAGLALGNELVTALRGGRFVGLPADALRGYNDFLGRLQAREHDRRSLPILNQSGSPALLGWLMAKAPAVPDAAAVEWLVGAATQIADRLQGRADWPFEAVANIEPQVRIVLRQLSPATLREMAVSFPWPTRAMAGAEVLPPLRAGAAEVLPPLRAGAAEEKQQQRWLQQLWGLLRPRDESTPQDDQRAKVRAQSRFDGRTTAAASSSSSSSPSAPFVRFEEAPRPRATSAPLKRSNGTRSKAPPRFRGAVEPVAPLAVPVDKFEAPRRSPSPPAAGGLGRMLSVAQRPNRALLAEAMTLALFRVDGEEVGENSICEYV